MENCVLPDFRIVKHLEWISELPLKDQPRESPVFLVENKELFFRFVLENTDIPNGNRKDLPKKWCYCLFLERKSDLTKVRKWQGRINVGLKNGTANFGSYSQYFYIPFDDLNQNVEKHQKCIWYSSFENIQQKLPPSYMDGNHIKFQFYFDSMPESLLHIGRAATENQPAVVSRCRVPLGSQESPPSENQTETVARCRATLGSQESPHSGVNIHLEALSRDLSKLLDKDTSCDVKITCEGKTFNAHRIILGIRSAVFSAMLESDMIEGETGLIKVEDFSASIFQTFLHYLYSGELPELNMENAKQFYEIADKYAVKELKVSCSEYWSKNLSESTACEILVLADQHGDEAFRKTIISYIVDKKIPQRDSEWSNFCENYSKLAVEVQNLYIQKYCGKIN